MTTTDFDEEIEAITRHIQVRGLDSREAATLCAISIGCLIGIKCDDNADKAEALGSLIQTARNWADMPVAH